MTALLYEFKPLDRLRMVSPLGLRFWDRVTEQAVRDGLRVTAYPLGQPGSLRRTEARANYSGVYAFQHLPGMREVEQGEGDASYWQSPPARRPFVIEVVDLERRFQPFLLDAELPVRDLFEVDCVMAESPPLSAPATVPLFSAPSRPVPGVMAVLRADLWDALAEKPAAWATLTARAPGQRSVTGIADEQGRVALFFPYPEPEDLLPDSPLSTGTSLWKQQWTLQLEARYDRLGAVAQTFGPQLQELCAILSQPEATLWEEGSPAAPLTETQLSYGQELILRSQSTTDQTPPSVLLITPAGSPP